MTRLLSALLALLLASQASASITLNGTSQYGTIDDAAACPVQGQDCWLTVWFKKAAPPAASGLIVGWTEAGAADSLCGIRMNSSGHAGIGIKPDNAGALSQTFTAVNVADGNWHCVTLWVSHAEQTVYGLVDASASVLTRPLTTGQTLALTRLCLGVQVRSSVDTALYWGGDVAEVRFGRGTIDEATARANYNLGFAKRDQDHSSRFGRWPLTSDANAAGGAGPNFTLVGSPTFSDDSAHFTAIDAFTPVAIDNDTAAEILEGGMESATSHRQAVTVTEAGYGVLGVVYKDDDGATAGQSATILLPSRASTTVTLSASAYANRVSEYVENGSRVCRWPFAGTFMTHVTLPAGTLRGVSVRTESRYGVVPLFGHSFHCSPTRVDHLGKDWRAHTGMDTRGAASLTKDGVLVFTDEGTSIARNGDDTYHCGTALAPQPAGVAVIATEHNGDLKACYVPDAGFSGTPTWYDLVPGGDNTYAQVASKADGTFYVLNRGTSDASNGSHAAVYHVSGISAGVPTVATDHLGGDGTRQYPSTNYNHDDELLGMAWTGAWNYGFAAVYDIAADKWYDLAKNQVGGDAKGTVGTPRFDNTEWTTTQAAGTGIRIYGNATGQTYQSSALFDLSDWDSTGGKAAFLYAETAGDLNEFAATTIRWVVQDGATRYVSGTDFSAPADWTCNSWRVFTKTIWKDGDPSTGIAYLCMIDHDDREAGGNYDTALPTGYTPYYDQGGRRIRVYKITAPCSASPTFELLHTAAPTGSADLTAGWVRSVPGLANTFEWQEATTELTEFKRGAEYATYEVEDDPSPASPRGPDPSEIHNIILSGLDRLKQSDRLYALAP